MYSLIRRQMAALLEGCPLPQPAQSNCAALLWHSLEDINWAGFYLACGDTLVLGPFQGKPACTIIPFQKGVCGAAARTREIQLVPDVHAFPRHIACDGASRSEIVLPLVKENRLLGVMDIDSPLLNRFSQEDAQGLAGLCELLMTEIDWSHGLLGE